MSKHTIMAILLFVAVLGGAVLFNSKKGSTPKEHQQKTEIPLNGSQTGNEESITQETNVPASIAPQSTIKEVTEISLTISTPLPGSTSTVSKAVVKGKTSPKAEVFANEAEGVADINGNFSLSVQLDEGENSIIVTAVDENGKVAEKEILVTYEINE